MFGPDKCGEDYKLHFIFRHQNPLNKDLEEKHAKRADVDLKKYYTDKKTHLYTLGMVACRAPARREDKGFHFLCLMLYCVYQKKCRFLNR